MSKYVLLFLVQLVLAEDPEIGSTITKSSSPTFVWTKRTRPLFPKPDENTKDFRDIIVEKSISLLFQRQLSVFSREDWFNAAPIKSQHLGPVNKPLIKFEMWVNNMRLYGLDSIKLQYLRVLRHFGLKDVDVYARIVGDLTLNGTYRMDGQALNIIPLGRNGDFTITVKGFSTSAVGYLGLRSEDTIEMNDLEVAVNHKEIHFDFKNLIGEGMVKQTADMIINEAGEILLESQKETISRKIKEIFRENVDMLIN